MAINFGTGEPLTAYAIADGAEQAGDESAIDALMAKRAAGLKTTSLHDVWMAGYRAGQDPNARMGDCPYPGRGKGEE